MHTSQVALVTPNQHSPLISLLVAANTKAGQVLAKPIRA